MIYLNFKTVFHPLLTEQYYSHFKSIVAHTFDLKVQLTRRCQPFAVGYLNHTCQVSRFNLNSPILRGQLPQSFAIPTNLPFWTNSSNFFYFALYILFLSNSSLKLVYKSAAESEKVTKMRRNLLLWITKRPRFSITTNNLGVVHFNARAHNFLICFIWSLA